MDITRDLAIEILKYLAQHKDFYFPFLVMCREYTPEDDDLVEIEPKEWKIIFEDETCQTFQLWENLQNLDKDTVQYMAQGFLEEMNIATYREWDKKKRLDSKFSLKPTVFTITKEEVEELFEEMEIRDELGFLKKLTDKQIEDILSCVECDEMLAKDIRNSIRGSVQYVLGDINPCYE